MSRRLVIVGSGIAGLYAALLASDAGADVVLLTKGGLEHSNTWYAQGGISAVLPEPAPGDTVAAHIADTLRAGAGHCNEAAVRLMCTEAGGDIAALQQFGVRFDSGPDGGPALGLEAAHSAPRILHAGGDATGARTARALIGAVLARAALGTLTVHTHAHTTALQRHNGRVAGVEYLQDGTLRALAADAVLLATGGAGRLFGQTTNPAVATADGLALAVRAGASPADLEFFQFHPTSLVAGATPRPERLDGPLLISEAVRGEGAVLVDAGNRRFMKAYHADAELAPRDVVSRSIALHLAKLGNPAGHVYLDARPIEQAHGAGFLSRRFPTLTQKTLDAGIDWTRELVPVAPAAHYWMGGIATDLHARTGIPGLYAAGEVACTGVQGANRLASNSLLEGLVFGRRAVEDFLSGDGGWDAFVTVPVALEGQASEPDVPQGSWQSSIGGREGAPEPFSREALRSLMTAKAGVLRSGALLCEAAETLDRWAAVVRPDAVPGSADPAVHEDCNLILAAQLLVSSALARRDSLGAHYRSDETVETIPLRPKASLSHD
ncbi:L-aspartate oxidase [Pseudarthrobacter chlorophenolicus A6]|uniref:L-aspartate oxidase n=1 Tax=Pseudarthrobacter chlorophenolicus (strain ATCC 700700 / DSM 12829 / CIP 107037 / JCM 12360 / KCTC 9906 / NCIMB 13794 / A6) TaxID=452863 RepID=B8HAU7_PSECP|nr:L-aspartate oxidase [Pseudarthrobacter chlorophenolicus]ACL40261.1 L-aspartate oxidase [Pseudarthrobacter chlorophenolicus A6]SDQ84769.1 L-aspartate oxidase [Pseudarthrobacter chlorophenolicus]